MTKIKFTQALNRFFPDLKDLDVEAKQLSDVIVEINQHFPGLSNYILEENGSLREHLNIYLDGEVIMDRFGLSDNIDKKREIVIFQAISGG